jgi:hypothetical protein
MHAYLQIGTGIHTAPVCMCVCVHFPTPALGVVEEANGSAALGGPGRETVSKVDLTARPFKLWLEGKEDQAPIQTQALIISTGATAKRMFLPGEDVYWQNGISACAVCDGVCVCVRVCLRVYVCVVSLSLSLSLCVCPP